MTNTKYTAYIDMDGVVADFDEKVRIITKGVSDTNDYSKNQMWKDIGYHNKFVEPFYETLPKKSDADALMKFVDENFEKVIFLTATGTAFRDISGQKRRWIEKNYPGHKVITVTSSSDKAVYANPNSILVDDRLKSIDPWERAGGIGVLHDNTSKSIKLLRELITH